MRADSRFRLNTPVEHNLQISLARAGAWLFVVGLSTGFWVALVVMEKVLVPIPRLAMAAHLNGMLGGLWLIAVAWTLQFMRYGERGCRWIAFLAGTAAWSNWLITLAASMLGVHGLQYNDDPLNNVVAFLLQLFVVPPALLAALAWAWGFGARHRGSTDDT
jgi:hypothetical protein